MLNFRNKGNPGLIAEREKTTEGLVPYGWLLKNHKIVILNTG
ncbi:MAG: hypothetical protein QXP36_12780 [Conexivisphaerales archaeon]